MDSGAVTIQNSKLRKLKAARQNLLQHYERLPIISCLVGLYSCQWRWFHHPKVEPGEWCCSKRECVFYPVLVTAFCSSFVFLYMWSEAENDYNNFDWFSYINLGIWFPWSVMLLAMAAVCFAYILLLVMMAVCLVSEGQQLYLHWCHKIWTVFILVLSISILAVITVMWTVQWNTVVLSMQFTAPFLHVVALFCMVLLSWPVALYTFRLDKKVFQVTMLAPYLALLFFLFFIPLGMYSPCIREKGTLGPKPALIGHRGAPMVAPENTFMAFAKIVEHHGDGFETDVRISLDGVPFLMHDEDLRRTTDVEEVFPEIANQSAAMFTWDELSKLNAGKWFFKKKPFRNMPPMSFSDVRWAKAQTVYRFSEFLSLADQENKLVIFDLKRPPEEHPYRHTWIFRTLYVMLQVAKIKPHLVLWLEDTERSHVRLVAPGFQQTSHNSVPLADLQAEKIVKLNLNYRDMSSDSIRKYAKANITTNLYVVNEPWLFSLAWCAGAHSVTTDAVHVLHGLTKPLFLMEHQLFKPVGPFGISIRRCEPSHKMAAIGRGRGSHTMSTTYLQSHSEDSWDSMGLPTNVDPHRRALGRFHLSGVSSSLVEREGSLLQ
ncbi:glycerophosphodiester phosphodiesterase domain-containing protein 4 isoform X2 [Sphaerodactylus townsendi]|uniref:glycerophosphodiester phosphodiesterase domain-containing protein 4 isoform X2 n=1 Tax=Sphaerodactylus townsendi TaxID=933632 RepID=UPI0020267709|nr:glycerophosphodiester phosphodiesterase domain-containing protein 4 isoform X2 [Sphaerodactylus townsendi]